VDSFRPKGSVSTKQGQLQNNLFKLGIVSTNTGPKVCLTYRVIPLIETPNEYVRPRHWEWQLVLITGIQMAELGNAARVTADFEAGELRIGATGPKFPIRDTLLIGLSDPSSKLQYPGFSRPISFEEVTAKLATVTSPSAQNV
jgi:hypothetical protein